MYRIIGSHPSVATLYGQKLRSRRNHEFTGAGKARQDYRVTLKASLDKARAQSVGSPASPPAHGPQANITAIVTTGVDEETLSAVSPQRHYGAPRLSYAP